MHKINFPFPRSSVLAYHHSHPNSSLSVTRPFIINHLLIHLELYELWIRISSSYYNLLTLPLTEHKKDHWTKKTATPMLNVLTNKCLASAGRSKQQQSLRRTTQSIKYVTWHKNTHKALSCPLSINAIMHQIWTHDIYITHKIENNRKKREEKKQDTQTSDGRFTKNENDPIQCHKRFDSIHYNLHVIW